MLNSAWVVVLLLIVSLMLDLLGTGSRSRREGDWQVITVSLIDFI